MKKIFEKLIGLDKLREEAAAVIKKAEEAQQAAEKAKEEERIAKLSPKEVATEKGEPWIQVLTTHVNKENVRNGFFELDWNEHFITDLKNSGYQGETDEEIVDKWFQELCKNVADAENVNMDRRGSGYVNRALRDDVLTEIG